MTDTNKLRDTILDMEASLSTNLNGYSMWHYGADIHGITRETLKNAIEALKAQEPRLMTLEEIQHTDAVWLETHGWVDGDVFETVLRRRSDFEDYVTEFATNDDCDITCVNSKIGIEWRCWTSKPDEKVRTETPWTQTNGL